MSNVLAATMAPVLRELAGPGTLIVLDFDGTLAPIVGDRTAARPSARTVALLHDPRRRIRWPCSVAAARRISDSAWRASPSGGSSARTASSGPARRTTTRRGASWCPAGTASSPSG